MSDTVIGHISPNVALHQNGTKRFTACGECGQRLGPASDPWKEHAIRRETPLAEAGGPSWDTGYEGVVLRQFFCPGCALLLDTETATERDPMLIDRLAEG